MPFAQENEPRLLLTLNKNVLGFWLLATLGSCTASVRLMHGVLSKPVCVRKILPSAGLKWGSHRFTPLRMLVC
jgi:hypothetical protein